MSVVWHFIRELLFALGCATAICTLLGLGLSIAVMIERAWVARHLRTEPRWLGDARTIEDLEVATLDAWFDLPAREPRA